MDKIKHTFVPTNGINMHIAELGSGPLVLFLHGFPEIWYSWRYQMLALAQAGFRAIAPDHRGYGLTENTDHTKLDYLDVVDDVVGLLDAIGEEKVFVVAKDWGAPVAYRLGCQHPRRIRAIVVLGIPYFKPPSLNTVSKSLPPSSSNTVLESLPPGHYITRFAKPGVPEADFGRFDVATVIKRIYILFCNSDMPIASENEHTLDLVKPSDPLPEWMTEEDLRVYAELYEKSSFKHPMEVPYRCMSRSREKHAIPQDFTIRAPVLLVIGNRDYASKLPWLQPHMWAGPDLLPQFKLVFLEEGTHFMQEQLPNQVNQLILDFLTPLVPK